MKYIFKEYTNRLQEYNYPYLVYLKKEEGDNINEIYKKGFLPTRKEKNLFYLSRNIRLYLPDFELTSENRRILKKENDLTLENKTLSESEYSNEISKLATDYFKTKFGKKIISTPKLRKIFEEQIFTNLLIYKKGEKIAGYCIAMETENLSHYAHPFYKKDLIGTNIGMGMMLKAIINAKENSKEYVYLGTVYTQESLYKTQFKGLEWFNGENWSKDIDMLKDEIKLNS